MAFRTQSIVTNSDVGNETEIRVKDETQISILYRWGQATYEAGFGASSLVLLCAWVFMAVSGLLIAETSALIFFAAASVFLSRGGRLDSFARAGDDFRAEHAITHVVALSKSFVCRCVSFVPRLCVRRLSSRGGCVPGVVFLFVFWPHAPFCF